MPGSVSSAWASETVRSRRNRSSLSAAPGRGEASSAAGSRVAVTVTGSTNSVAGSSAIVRPVAPEVTWRHQGRGAGRMKTDMGTLLKRVKSLPPGALIGIMVGGVLVFALAGWFLLVHPQGAKLKDLKSQTAEVQSKLDAYHQ